MAKVDYKIVEQEVNEMFQEHKTTQGVVEALLIETGWDADAIRAAQEATEETGSHFRARRKEEREEREERSATEIDSAARPGAENGASPR